MERSFRAARTEIKEAKDVLVGELATSGLWITVSIETTSFWPVTAQKVQFRGRSLWIVPLMKERYPSVAINKPDDLGEEECERLLIRFLSALSWTERRGFQPLRAISAGQVTPRTRVDPFGASVCQEIRTVYLPEPADDRATLALALMREGRSLNHPAYAFLSYFRVLEHALPNGMDRTQWMASALASLHTGDAAAALAKLARSGVADVGAHLYHARRSAIAHAREGAIIDPDDPSQLRAVEADLPIIAALAERAIEDVLGVPTSLTIYDQHLFELSGFKKLLGPELVEIMLSEANVDEGRTVSFPLMDLRIRRRAQHPTLASLAVERLYRDGKVLRLALRSQNRFAQIRLGLDFENERLLFDPFDGLYGEDDGSAEAAEAVADMKRFGNELLLNGELQIFDSESAKLIARKEAFYLTNAMFDLAAGEAEVARWLAIAAERRNPELVAKHAFDRLSRRYVTTLEVAFAAP